MKFLKVFTCIMLVLCMLLTLAACGGDDKDSKKENDSNVAGGKVEDPTDDENKDPIASEDEEPAESEDEEPSETSEAPSEEVVSDGDLAEQLVGEWGMEADMSKVFDALLEQFAQQLGADPSKYAGRIKFNMEVVLDFNEDNTVEMKIDKDAVVASMDASMGDLIDVMVDIMYDYFEAQGVDRETADETIVAQYGCSLKEYLEQSYAESMNADTLFGDSVPNMKGTYKLEGNKIYLVEDGEEFDEDDYAIVSISGDKLTLDGDNIKASTLAEMAEFGLPLPWIFTRR